MKRKYREAMRTAQRLQDSYIDGEDDDALEVLDWFDENVPPYEGELPDSHLDEQIPF